MEFVKYYEVKVEKRVKWGCEEKLYERLWNLSWMGEKRKYEWVLNSEKW